MDDADTVVFSGSAKATVTAGQTATVTVDLESALGNLAVEFTVPAVSTATSYTVEITHSEDKEFSKKETISDGTSVLFNDLIPGSYTISVQGMNAGTIVLSGTAKATVVEGQPVTATVNLELSPGILTVNFSETGDSTASNFTIELTGSNGTTPIKTVSGGSTVQFDDLAPDTYHIVVEGIDTNNKVIVGGASSATVTAGTTASATVNLVEGVSDYDSLQKAVGNGGTVNILKSIDVPSSLTVGTNVTIQAAYQDVTLKNISSGNLFIIDNSSGNLTIGGGEYTITLDGGEVAKSIIHMTAGTATLRDKGIIRNAAASGVNVSSGTFEMTGGTISGNENNNSIGGGVSIKGGTFIMTGGIISENSSSFTGGGGVGLYSGSFNFSGGKITDNEVGTGCNGKGVYVGGTFQMSGSAVIDSNNDVYLNNSKTITITGELTGGDTVATITLASYNEGTQVLSAESGVDLANEVGKFAVTPNPADDSEWTIDPNTGNLVQ